MIIYLNKEGRLGHQLSQFMTLMSYQIEFNRPFFYKSFIKKYINLFSTKYNNINFVTLNLVIIIYRILKLRKINYYKLYKYEFFICVDKKDELIFHDTITKMYKSNSKYVITDYILNDVNMTSKYINTLRIKIGIKDEIEKKIKESFIISKKKYDTIIAIHIRKSDFQFLCWWQILFF
jgi:hypothetical protein